MNSFTHLVRSSQNLEEFKKKIQGYLRLSRNSQKELAEAIGLHPKVLSRKLSPDNDAILAYPEIQAIIRTLARWHAIVTKAEALELLALLNCPSFLPEEWNEPPLDSLIIEDEEQAIEAELENGDERLINSSAVLVQPQSLPSIAGWPEVPAHNLPVQLTSFIGREKEIAEIKQLLVPVLPNTPAARLVTLTGVGGIGKSRLALEVASQLLNDFVDGVWLVELAALTDPGIIPQAIAEVFDLAETANRPILKTLSDYLKKRQLLLILDDCEHLVEACARVVNTLMSACPDLQLIVTSREALRVPGETVFRIPSLALPKTGNKPDTTALLEYEALRLFVERAISLNSQFVLTEQLVPDLVHICRTLDGIPLALELAAARTNILTLEQINLRLTDCFHLLKSGNNRTALPRQQTLRGLIDWSYNLLNDREKLLFRRLSVFSGSFSLVAAEAVGTDHNLKQYEVLDLLSQLVGKSLTVVEEATNLPRYRYLETIRKYAQEQLEASGEAELLKHKQLDYYVALAEEAYAGTVGAAQVGWFTRLDREHDNLRSVLGWTIERQLFEPAIQLSGALGRYWYVRCYYSEGLNWLQAIVPNFNTPTAEKVKAYQARALYWMATLAMPLGQYQEATPLYEQSLALARELDDKKNLTRVLNRLGELARNQGHYSSARDLLEESLVLAGQLVDQEVTANALCNSGEVEWDQGNYDRAEEYYQKSLQLFITLGDQIGLAKATLRLGQVARVRGRYAQAQVLFEQSYAIFKQQYNLWGMASTLHRQGLVAFDLAEYGKARQFFERSLALFNQHGDRWGIAEQLAELGQVCVVQAEFEKAARFFEDSLTLYQEIGISLQIANLIARQGELALRQGHYDRAKVSLQEGLALQRELAAKPGIARTLSALGNLAYHQADYQLALTLYTESLELNRVMQDRLNLARNLEELSIVYRSLDEVEKAEETSDEAAAILTSIAAATKMLEQTNQPD